MPPRFSVVIPTKDSAGSISRCIAGVLSQTFAAIEVIVVDAGSSDGTLDAVRSLADSRVRVLAAPTRSTAENTGPRGGDLTTGHARAAGFRHCHGQWSTTLDPSDEVSPTWLSRLGKLVDRSGASFISCGGEQRFADMSETRILPVAVPCKEGVSACLRSGSFTAPTSYFRPLSSTDLSDLVTAGLMVLDAVIADGLSCVSTPEPLLRWNEDLPVEECASREEQELSWAMQALDALSRSPIPDGQLLARYAALGGQAAARLGRRDDARKLFAIARNTLPEVPRYWLGWASALLPFGLAPNVTKANSPL